MINPAKDDADRLIEASPDLRRAAIGAPWDTKLFRRHLIGASHGDWPLAVTDGAVVKRLASWSGIVRLSGDTAAKQAVYRQGQDFWPEHYAIVQRAIDEGKWFDGDQALHTVGFVKDGDRWWKATLKRTQDGSPVYLQSLHRVKVRKVHAARSKLQGFSDCDGAYLKWRPASRRCTVLRVVSCASRSTSGPHQSLFY